MERIIINNRTEYGLSAIMRFVNKVIEGGKVSADNTCYAYVTAFKVSDDDGAVGKLVIFCDKTKTGFKFDARWEMV